METFSDTDNLPLTEVIEEEELASWLFEQRDPAVSESDQTSVVAAAVSNTVAEQSPAIEIEASLASSRRVTESVPEAMKLTHDIDHHSGDLLPEWPALRLGGWFAQGFTGNVNRPSNGLNRPVVFNDLANKFSLHQAYLHARTDLYSQGNDWSLIAGLDVNYGYDSQYLTVPGLERHQDGTRKLNSEDSDYGLSFPQLFFELRTKLGDRPLTLKLGRFLSLTSSESLASPANALYSHSYSFSYANPFTQSGVLAAYQTSPGTTWFLGYNQGWDNWRSRSNRWGILSGIALQDAADHHEFRFFAHLGEDLTNALTNSTPITGSRNSFHATYRRALHRRLRYVVDAVAGSQEDAVIVVHPAISQVSFRTARWYGLTQYLHWTASDRTRASLRVEWFRDADHSRIGTPVEFDPGGLVLNGGDYFGLTAGCQTRLFPNVLLRPEIRWDWSNTRGSGTVPGGDPSVRAFGDRTDAEQLTLAADFIIQY
ncbi:outer membrane beta-barrel protein [Stieleria magnilauensis]|uniref:outer membrane beta-barrel protein n=1 Tax=Stieleria magnilauensis TaxID=2527963 RepID=UPI003AF67A0F